ncbi:hypothetical protein J4X41_06075, partial [Escherichia coli]
FFFKNRAPPESNTKPSVGALSGFKEQDLPCRHGNPEMIDIDHISAFKLLTFLFHPMKSFIFK